MAAPLVDVDAALGRIAEASLVDGPVRSVGLELEAHCFDLADPRRRPGWRQLTEVIGALPTMPGGSAVTVEPGGAVELSGPPLPAAGAVAALASDRLALVSAFADACLGLVLLGADPLRPPQRVNPGARYGAMETFFAATGTAEAGAAMMTSTASVQINLDAGPRRNWADRVRLAHALGPTLIAVAGNSPLLGGRATGWKSSRQRVWGNLDVARCGPVLGGSGDDPGSDWARYALRAPVMLVNGTAGALPVTAKVPMEAWISGAARLDDRRPTAADLDYHLTTLFPPVRPRGWLEIRYLDSVPDACWPALVSMVVTLLDDPVAADIATEATEPVATAWDTAARVGLADPALHTAARRCVAAVADRVPESMRESMHRLAGSVQQGRCPGDDFAADAARRGPADAVMSLARGESLAGGEL